MYTIQEYPHPINPHLALLDINEDQEFDYSFKRAGLMPFTTESSDLQHHVFSTKLYRLLQAMYPELPAVPLFTKYHWIHGSNKLTNFNTSCEKRGKLYAHPSFHPISSNVFFPANKIKQLLCPDSTFENDILTSSSIRTHLSFTVIF